MRGLSLAELVVSFCLLLLVVIFVFELYPMSIASVRGTAARLQASALADTILADAMQRPFSDLAVGPAPALNATTVTGVVLQPVEEFLEVNPAGVNSTQIRAIRVTVSWTEHGFSHQLVRQQWRTDVQR